MYEMVWFLLSRVRDRREAVWSVRLGWRRSMAPAPTQRHLTNFLALMPKSTHSA